MKLYGFPRTRSNRAQWALEEAGLAYEFVKVELPKGEHKGPDHVARHGHGLVPAFDDGPLHLIESGAIAMYVADKAHDKKLAPAPGTPERGRYYQWVVYATSTLDKNVLGLFFEMVFTPEDKRSAEKIDKFKADWAVSAKLLEGALERSPYLAGDSFSVADIAVGYDLQIAAKLGLLEGHAKLQEYLGRLTARPAYKKVFPD